ncbi:MAG: putative amino acid permease-associated region [Mucilaginibacter sp.]|uniref:APC family permease n=1 Tax=Mucilaginibacter sp. TaxID=1882438 RepID=UPI002611DF66|nr:APC family permease [Mucilaginibacter sp.]MDB5004398.1 putative amino acid permease-associated region [Mucilaginibacter sp.]
MDTSGNSLFDRQRSGYTREFSMLDVFIFNILGFSLGLALSSNPAYIGMFVPHSNILIVIGLGAILAFFNGLVYGWFGAIMPSTGGDYVFVSRSISHRIGFLTNWGFTFCQLYGFAANTSWIFAMAIRPSLLAIGFTSPLPARLTSIIHTSDLSWLLISLSIALFYYLISLLNMRFSRPLVILLFLVGISSPILMAYFLATHTHGDFVSAFNDFVVKNGGHDSAYETVVNMAKARLANAPKTTVFADSLKGLPLGFLCFLGFTYSVYAGGEIEKPEKAQIRGILFALLVGLLAFLGCMGLYAEIVGPEFYGAIGIGEVQTAVGINNAPMNFLTGLLAREHPILNIIMQVGNLIWFLLVPYVILQVCTRNFIAWACDEMFPSWYLKRLPGTNAPWAASLMVTVIGMVFIIILHYSGVSLVGAAALAAVAYLFTGYAAFRLPKVLPEVYKRAPRLAKRTVFDIDFSFFQLAGLISIVGFGYIVYAAVKYPDVAGGDSDMALVMIAVVYLFGLCVYQWRKNKLKKKHDEFTDFNINDLFKEIPED